MRWRQWWWAGVLLASWGPVGVADAQTDVRALAQRLKTSDDFRVRTQAALALGASNDVQAVEPLCLGLDDKAVTVRAAAAAALGKLAKGGRECLKARLPREASGEVKAVIQRALGKLEPEPAKMGPDTRVYVAIGDATNKTGRPDAALNAALRRLLTKHFERFEGVVLAPPNETSAAAKQLLKKYPTVKAIYVLPKVVTQYGGGSLQMKIDFSLFTYPDKSMIGTLSKKLTVSDTEPGDVATEDELLDMAADQLAPDVKKYAGRS